MSTLMSPVTSDPILTSVEDSGPHGAWRSISGISPQKLVSANSRSQTQTLEILTQIKLEPHLARRAVSTVHVAGIQYGSTATTHRIQIVKVATGTDTSENLKIAATVNFEGDLAITHLGFLTIVPTS